jgi:hypothetical protein
MPTYVYKCPVCAAKRDIVKKVAELDRVEHCLKCSFAMNRQLVAPMVRPDYAGYTCPITGDWIEGRAAHEANLRKHGCRVLEDGERQEAEKVAKARDEAFLESVGETAARFVAQLPPSKQEQLAKELDAGAGISVERATPTIT